MKVGVLVKATQDSEAGAMPDTELLAAMTAYNQALVDAGIMVSFTIPEGRRSRSVTSTHSPKRRGTRSNESCRTRRACRDGRPQTLRGV